MKAFVLAAEMKTFALAAIFAKLGSFDLEYGDALSAVELFGMSAIVMKKRSGYAH